VLQSTLFLCETYKKDKILSILRYIRLDQGGTAVYLSVSSGISPCSCSYDFIKSIISFSV
jgi:hypothetical protein